MRYEAVVPALAGALLGLGIAWLPPGSTSADLPRWVAAGAAAAVLLLGVRRLDRWDGLLLTWPLILVVAALLSPVPALGLWGAARGAVLVTLAIGARRLDEDAAGRLLPWVVAGVALQGGLALGQALGFTPAGAAVLQTDEASYAIQGTLGHRNVLAGTLAMSAPLAWRAVHPALAVALAVSAVATGSSGAVLGLASGAAVLAWSRVPPRWRWPGAALLLTSTVVGVGVVAATGASGRVPLWQTSWDLFIAHPLTGVGPGQLGNAYLDATLERLYAAGQWDAGGTAARHAHLELLHAAVEAGVLGAIAWLAVWVAPLGRWVQRMPTGHGLAAGTTVAVALGHGLVSFPLELAVPGAIGAVALGLALGPATASRLPGWPLMLVPLLALVPLTQRALADRGVGEARTWALSDPQRGVDAASRALSWFPAEGQASYWRGMALQRLGELPAAESALRDSLRTNDHHVGRRDLGLLLAELGRSEEAIAWLEDYLWVHPGSSPRPFLVLGASYLDLDRFDEAVEAFDRCQCTEGFHRAGDVLMMTHQPVDALYRWRQAGDDEAVLKQIAHLLAEGDEETAKPLLMELEDVEARRRGVSMWQGYRSKLP